jgi:hypothetical protein
MSAVGIKIAPSMGSYTQGVKFLKEQSLVLKARIRLLSLESTSTMFLNTVDMSVDVVEYLRTVRHV